MTNLFQFELDILSGLVYKQYILYTNGQDKLREMAKDRTSHDDPHPVLHNEQPIQAHNQNQLLFIERQIEDATVVTVDDNAPLTHVVEGAYVVLRCHDPDATNPCDADTIEKYVIGHLGRPEDKILNMGEGLGRILTSNQVAANARVGLGTGCSAVTYTVLEFSWGVPVVDLERRLSREYNSLKSCIENARRDHGPLDDISKKISDAAARAAEEQEKLAIEYSRKAAAYDRPLSSPLAYIHGTRGERIAMRESTPAELIHYHRMVDAYERQIGLLNGLVS